MSDSNFTDVFTKAYFKFGTLVACPPSLLWKFRAKIVGCHQSTALRIYTNFLKTASVAKLLRTGRPKNIAERDEKAVCRRARKLKFNTLEDILEILQQASTIVKV